MKDFLRTVDWLGALKPTADAGVGLLAVLALFGVGGLRPEVLVAVGVAYFFNALRGSIENPVDWAFDFVASLATGRLAGCTTGGVSMKAALCILGATLIGFAAGFTAGWAADATAPLIDQSIKQTTSECRCGCCEGAE